MTTPAMLNVREENFRERPLIREICENLPPRKFPAIRYSCVVCMHSYVSREYLHVCVQVGYSAVLCGVWCVVHSPVVICLSNVPPSQCSEPHGLALRNHEPTAVDEIAYQVCYTCT